MLIINADDWGRNKESTDNAVACFKNGRITSVSAMVFMAESERAAALALENGLDVGLHLNLTSAFDGDTRTVQVMEAHQRIASFLKRSKYCSLVYNPLLRGDLECVYDAQLKEFLRLYNKEPTHIDGHHHMHLWLNVLIQGLFPKGSKVRRSFSFSSGEKSVLNRIYRSAINKVLTRSYVCADFMFSLSAIIREKRMQSTAQLAQCTNVELVVHPEVRADFEYLMSEEYFEVISRVDRGGFIAMKVSQ
jgi:chitin disaccharide deacetylase